MTPTAVPERVLPPTQAMPAELDHRQVASEAWQRQLDGMQSRGELNFTSWTGSSRPSRGWDFAAISNNIKMNTPSVPKFEGANVAMPWLAQATNIIRGAEGFEPAAYHGFGSAARNTGKFRVTPGDAIGADEVSVGYGFNLTQKGARQMYAAALAGQGAPNFDDVLNGRKPISRANADSLQEYMILEKSRILDSLNRRAGNVPLRDHQRAALVSMLYQGYSPKALLDAMARGDSDEQVADLLRGTGNPKFKSRRSLEAALFLGAKAESYFDNSTNQLQGRTG
ncbi:hypothetical protein [Achromobacter sp. DH1f]|uniref:hypothetical protein n=1 Tax=Achromobacter sp. DH1f TaxID=1397275 RepID=UPI0012FF36FB|nr:hypothetical protein [Achromobacter sp. DH1f]